jgi:hypothetical protein
MPSLPDTPPGGPRALLRYVAAWVLVGAAVAVALIWILPGDGELDRAADLPPVRQIELVSAVRAAGCTLHRGPIGGEPEVAGPRTIAARPGVYDDDLPSDRLVTAMRRGIVVLRYHGDLDGDDVSTLESLQAAVPNGTLLTVDSALPFAVGATAWRRVLACPSLTDRTVDAIRLFQGRFLGSGPDSPP